MRPASGRPSRAATLLSALVGIAGAVALASPAPAQADAVEVASGTQRLRIALEGGLPVEWVSCAPRCDAPDARRVVLVGAGGGSLAWAAASAAAADTVEALRRTRFTARTERLADGVRVVLQSADPAGKPLEITWELDGHTHGLRLRATPPAGVGLAMASGAGFVPAKLPGFGAAFSDVGAVRVGPDDQARLDTGEGVGVEESVAPGEWLGIRRRFWAWLAQPEGASTASVVLAAPDQPVVRWDTAGGSLALAFYAGPVEWKSLRVVAPELANLLFASLWEPLRWLCYGLFFLLGWISRWVGNAGLAIILLSLAVKIILWPLTRIADRWQQEVNRIQGRIQPRIAAIRREFRGEEAHNRTLQVYRDEGVHPLFTLKSLAGFAIQVPMFIAAFDMLADNYALSGAQFLWIDDLAAPDRFAALPVALPFFGGDLNLLSAVMTLFTVLSAVTQRDESLTPELLRSQQRQLYLMAGGFFLLFYTFPAGMVLYWTANNVWHFLKIQALAWLAARR